MTPHVVNAARPEYKPSAREVFKGCHSWRALSHDNL
jgi:hypothetical protein